VVVVEEEEEEGGGGKCVKGMVLLGAWAGCVRVWAQTDRLQPSWVRGSMDRSCC
jgi:hypothetical protein